MVIKIKTQIIKVKLKPLKILFSNEPKNIISTDALGKKLSIIEINNNQIKNLEPFYQSVAKEEFLFNIIQLSESQF